MSEDTIEYGPLPINDPTIAEGAVLVLRSMAVNALVDSALNNIMALSGDLTPEASLRPARDKVLELLATTWLHRQPEGWADRDVKLAHCVVQYIREQIGIDPNRWTLNLFMSMVQSNTVIVIYGIVGGIH